MPTANPAWNDDAPDPASSNGPYRIYNIGNRISVWSKTSSAGCLLPNSTKGQHHRLLDALLADGGH